MNLLATLLLELHVRLESRGRRYGFDPADYAWTVSFRVVGGDVEIDAFWPDGLIKIS